MLLCLQPATCVAVSPENTYFATGGLDCLVRLYDMATGKVIMRTINIMIVRWIFVVWYVTQLG